MWSQWGSDNGLYLSNALLHSSGNATLILNLVIYFYYHAHAFLKLDMQPCVTLARLAGNSSSGLGQIGESQSEVNVNKVSKLKRNRKRYKNSLLRVGINKDTFFRIYRLNLFINVRIILQNTACKFV